MLVCAMALPHVAEPRGTLRTTNLMRFASKQIVHVAMQTVRAGLALQVAGSCSISESAHKRMHTVHAAAWHNAT